MRSPRVLKHPLGAAGADRLLGSFEPLHRGLGELDAPYLVRRLIRQGAAERARRWAASLVDPAARLAASGWSELAAGRRPEGERLLRRALRLDAGNGEARAALWFLRRAAIAAGQSTATLPGGSPEHRAVADGWRLMMAGAWRGVQSLEDRLAGLGPRHPLFAAATRLRVEWRVASGDAALAREGLELLSPLLAPLPEPRDLLLRARAGTAAGKPRIALAAIGEALALPGSTVSRRALLPAAWRIVESLPKDEEIENWRWELGFRPAWERPGPPG